MQSTDAKQNPKLEQHLMVPKGNILKIAVNKLRGKLLLFAISTMLREDKIKLSELLQILLILARGEIKIFFKTLFVMHEKQIVKILTLKVKFNLLS